MGEHVPHEIVSAAGWDRLLEALSAVERRQILFMLARGEPVTESGLTVRGSHDRDRRDRRIRHVHLPKLVDTGYVEWDRETGEVEKGPRYDEVEPLLDLIENHSDELPPDWP